MTKEEILEMKADGWSLNLSDAVAIQFMGWHRNTKTKTWIDNDGDEQAHWRWCPELYIAEAWQVIEKVRSDKLLLYHFGLALSEMTLNQECETRADYIADLMRWLCPEAICKAALIAMERE